MWLWKVQSLPQMMRASRSEGDQLSQIMNWLITASWTKIGLTPRSPFLKKILPIVARSRLPSSNQFRQSKILWRTKSVDRACWWSRTWRWSRGISILFIHRTRSLSLRIVSRVTVDLFSVARALVSVSPTMISLQKDRVSLTTSASRRRSWRPLSAISNQKAPGIPTRNSSRPTAQSSQAPQPQNRWATSEWELKIQSMETLAKNLIKVQIVSWLLLKLCQQVIWMVL